MDRFKILLLILFFIILITFLWGNIKYRVVPFHIGNGSDEYQFRVLTWNICGAKICNRKKQEDITRLIISQEADIVQLNEFCLDSCLIMDSLLNVFYPYKNDINSKSQVGDISYSKIPLVESRKISGIPNVIISKLNFSKDSLYFFGCHLAGNNREGQIEIHDADSLRRVKTFWTYYRNAQEKRKVAASSIKKEILTYQLPVIVLGDMNDFNTSAPMDSLKDAGLKNAWWKGGSGYGATYHEGWLRLRIDHIYYNDKLKLKGVKVVNTDLSDHNLLIADFSFVN